MASLLPTFPPKNFLGLIPLQNATEFIFILLFINKLSGIFGVLALFTGASISVLQLSMYLYSLACFGTLVYIAPRIMRRSPLPTISFAYLFLLDSFLNALYTLFFGVGWFMVLASPASVTGGAAGTIADTAGFTSPIVNASKVEVVATPSGAGQAAVAVGTPAEGNILAVAPESLTSIVIICCLWVVRVYFLVVVFAHAREVVREAAEGGEGPFDGLEGWRGKLGRGLVGVGKGYWMGNKGWGSDRWGGVRGKGRRSEEQGERLVMSQPVRGHRRGASLRLNELEV